MKHLTWEDTVNFVLEIHTREGAQPSRILYRMLADQCCREIAENTPIYRKSWTNDGADGSPVLTGNCVTLPADLLSVDSVEWDHNMPPLDRRTTDQLDLLYPGWRASPGEPTAFCQPDSMTLLLNTIPQAPGASKLVIRGRAYLPAFSDTPTEPNPLEYFPVGQQLIVAYYILWNLPVVPVVPINDSAEAAALAQFSTQRRVDNRSTYKAKYDEMLLKLAAVDNTRKRDQFTY